ncbi:MAG: hypothetical protein R3F14_33470 [Polyangiaceae bacterium]
MIEHATPLRVLLSGIELPVDFLKGPDGPLGALLDRVYFADYGVLVQSDGVGLLLDLVFAGEAALSIPGLDSLALVFGGDSAGATQVRASAFAGPAGVAARLDDISIALRFPPALLKPVPEAEGLPAPEHAEIRTHGNIALDEDGSIRVEGFDSLTLPPVMIGDSGVVISASDVKLDLSTTGAIPEVLDAGFDEGFVGVFIGEARVHLPDGLPALAPEDLVLRRCALGSGGITGELEAIYNPTFDPQERVFNGQGASTACGIPFALREASLEIRQNAFRRARFDGWVLLPFFDEPVGLGISLGASGLLSASLSASDALPLTGGGQYAAGDVNGLVTLRKEGLLSLTIDSLSMSWDGQTGKVALSGSITPLLGAEQGLEWPTFDIDELSIDSHGNVKLDGGWLDLRNGYTLDFFGFEIEITKLGFGKSDDGGQWVGFSGGIQLAEGITAGASVEGLRITWYSDGRDPRLSLNGAGVELVVPDVLSFKGAVSFREFKDRQGRDIKRFDGRIALNLLFAGLEIDAQVVFGIDATNSSPFMAITLDVESPVGYPLGTTGLALYGVAGLVAVQMEPDKLPDEAWYSISRKDWFHRDEAGVSDLTKWRYTPGAFALGAGATIGTLADNGYTFSGKMLLVVVIPGPVILLEGRANLLKERSKLSEEPAFHALAVLDARAGELLFGVDAKYAYDPKGSIIDIAGSSEMYFSFNDPTAWHLYLGKKEPVAERIQAKIFDLFRAQSWFMLDHRGLDTGMWVGFNWSGSVEIVSVSVNAWIEGGAKLSFRPVHFTGNLDLYGMLAVSVLGVGFVLELDAHVEGEIDRPSRLLAHLSFSLDMPWPFDDIRVDFDLRLGPTVVMWPPLPLPLEEVAVEHFRSTQAWALRRAPLRAGEIAHLVPNLDVGGGNRTLAFPAPLVVFPQMPVTELPDSKIPVVPLDSRPHITFRRPVHDDAFAGVNSTRPQPDYERIGDPSVGAGGAGPARARYSLKSITLEARTAGGWRRVARCAGVDPNPDGTPKLYGSWAPTPMLPGGEPSPGSDPPTGNTKLWVYSKDPFDSTRRTVRAWDEWFNEQFASYPCPAETREWVGYPFNAVPTGPLEGTHGVDFPWRAGKELVGWEHPLHPDDSTLLVSWWPAVPRGMPSIEAAGRGRALFVRASLELSVMWSFAAASLRIVASSAVPFTVRFYVHHGNTGGFGTPAETVEAGGGVHRTTEVRELHFGGFPAEQGTIGIWIKEVPPGGLFIHEIRLLPKEGTGVPNATLVRHMEQSLQRFSEEAFVFEASTTYRLAIATQIDAELRHPDDDAVLVENRSIAQTEYAYFRTEGPPGLANLSLPPGTEPTEDNVLHLGTDGAGQPLHYVTIDGTPTATPVLRSELNDLEIYVSQTMPPTRPSPGSAPSCHGPCIAPTTWGSTSRKTTWRRCTGAWGAISRSSSST